MFRDVPDAAFALADSVAVLVQDSVGASIKVEAIEIDLSGKDVTTVLRNTPISLSQINPELGE